MLRSWLRWLMWVERKLGGFQVGTVFEWVCGVTWTQLGFPIGPHHYSPPYYHVGPI